MRQKIINENFTGQTFEDKQFNDYYRNCNFTNCTFKNCTFNCVMTECNFTNANFEKSRIDRLYSPKCIFTNAKFRKEPGLIHLALSKFLIGHNHEIIAEILRKWATSNLTGEKRTLTIQYSNKVKARIDLSWSELTRMAPDDIIKQGLEIFKDYPILLNALRKARTDL